MEVDGGGVETIRSFQPLMERLLNGLFPIPYIGGPGSPRYNPPSFFVLSSQSF